MNDILQYSHAVELIKNAIEQSRYRASKSANAELLSLYYGIGRFVSENTRKGVWGDRCNKADI